MSEKCDRCKNMGEDRRTLLMRCFYSMKELGIPFDEEILFYADIKDLEKSSDPVSLDLSDGKKLTIAPGKVKSSGELTPESFYKLRICKRCRAEWLQAIKAWFFAVPEGIDHDADEREVEGVGSGIFIRENGAIMEITEEEWRKKHEEKVKR